MVSFQQADAPEPVSLIEEKIELKPEIFEEPKQALNLQAKLVTWEDCEDKIPGEEFALNFKFSRPAGDEWPSTVSFHHVAGDEIQIVGTDPIQADEPFSVKFQAPDNVGKYFATFRLRHEHDFGDKVHLNLNVDEIVFTKARRSNTVQEPKSAKKEISSLLEQSQEVSVIERVDDLDCSKGGASALDDMVKGFKEPQPQIMEKTEAEKKQEKAEMMMSKLDDYDKDGDELMKSFEVEVHSPDQEEDSPEPFIIEEESKEKNQVGGEPSQPGVLIEEKKPDDVKEESKDFKKFKEFLKEK